jgi:hypothetical protein
MLKFMMKLLKRCGDILKDKEKAIIQVEDGE